MATCKNCKRNGFFLQVNPNGLCNICSVQISYEIKNRFALIQDSMRIVETGTVLSTRVSRCNFIIENAQSLSNYARMGLPTIKPDPSVIIKTYTDLKLTIIKETLLLLAKKAIEKSKLATTLNSKISPLSKVVIEVAEYRHSYPDDADLNKLELGLKNAIQETQFNLYIDEAKKAEFKGNKKKALDKYYEALYLLQHDDVNDRLQQDQMTIVQEKILELSA